MSTTPSVSPSITNISSSHLGGNVQRYLITLVQWLNDEVSCCLYGCFILCAGHCVQHRRDDRWSGYLASTHSADAGLSRLSWPRILHQVDARWHGVGYGLATRRVLDLVNFRCHDHVLSVLGLWPQCLRPSRAKSSLHQVHGIILRFLPN